MAAVEDTSTPGTQQDEKKFLDVGGQHLKVKEVRTSLISSVKFLFSKVSQTWCGGVWGILCDQGVVTHHDKLKLNAERVEIFVDFLPNSECTSM
jgi:hypothetical protein